MYLLCCLLIHGHGMTLHLLRSPLISSVFCCFQYKSPIYILLDLHTDISLLGSIVNGIVFNFDTYVFMV